MLSKSKCTLVIDGNWLLMSRLSVLNNRYKDDHELCQDLKILMIRSINIVLKTFPVIDNIIFVSDGGSWRNKIEIPSFLAADNVEYKGNRERSEDINWELIFNEFDSFISVLSQTGITCSRHQYIEGDDWCWYWSTKLNSNDTNCIIWSKDKDLTQLVKTNEDGCFTVWWNKESGLIVEDKPEEEMNFLFNHKFNQNEEILSKINQACKKITKIDPHTIVIDKIVRGDMGDNIIPIIFRSSKNVSDKKFRVSAKDLDTQLDIHSESDIRHYIHTLLNSKKYIDRVEKSEEDIVEHFKYNTKLVELSEENYPDFVKEIFDAVEENTVSKDITIAENLLQASTNKLTNVLDFI